MKRSNLVLLLLNISVVAAGAVLLVRGSASSQATLTNGITLPGIYDIIRTADINADGQITSEDALAVKGCVGSAGQPIPPECRGQWQQVSSSAPPDGVIRHQKIGQADINGDGRVTLSDALYVMNCVGKPVGDPCYGELRPRRIIRGRIVDTSGKGVAGVNLIAVGIDSDGDPYP